MSSAADVPMEKKKSERHRQKENESYRFGSLQEMIDKYRPMMEAQFKPQNVEM